MFIPRHLMEISETPGSSLNVQVYRIKCACGCFAFFVYENKDGDGFLNNRLKYNEFIREDQKIYLVRRNFFGKIVSRIECDSVPSQKTRKVIKVRCSCCGKYHVVFDNYVHGFDAVANPVQDVPKQEKDALEYRVFVSRPLEVYVQIQMDMTCEELVEEFGTIDMDIYSRVFSSIKLWGIDSKKRRVELYCEETM